MKQKIVLIASIAVGLLAAFLTRAYLTAKDAEVARAKTRFYEAHGLMTVLCYGKNTPGGTPLQKSDLGTRRVPAAGLRGQALTEENLQDVLGRRIIAGRNRGDILFWGDFEGGNPRGGGLADAVKRQMRAVSINASGAAAVSGMVRPADHVDVIGTFSFPGAEKNGRAQQDLVTCTILQNVLVLATGRDTANSAGRDPFNSGASYTTVTLEVSPREAEMLVFAEQIKGRLSLSLRNRNDTSYEKELPQVDFAKIRGEIESLNVKRQSRMGGR